MTTKIGFTDAAHTHPNGNQASYVGLLNNTGVAAGYSYRYAAGGSSAWFYDANASSPATIRVGLTTSGYESSTGSADSSVHHINDAGLLTGYSRRYDGSSYIGYSAWVVDTQASTPTTTRIGFTDSEHTGNGGLQYSYTNGITASGIVAGNSERYQSNGNHNGRTAWMVDGNNPTTPTKLGFTGTGYTRTDTNYRESYTNFVTDSGLVGGYSQRYDGTAYNGQSAWFVDTNNGSLATQVGLTDAEHKETAPIREAPSRASAKGD